ncbi:MAG: flagellar filament capping protein FliD [Acidovorax sp.]
MATSTVSSTSSAQTGTTTSTSSGTKTNSTGSFSALGIGLNSSVDVNALIDSQVAIASLPITRSGGLNDQVTLTNAKISTYGQIKSLVSTLADATSALTSVTGWNAMAATSSNTSAVTVTATGGTAATSFDVTVTQLAKAQTTMSASIPTGTSVNAGTLSIQLGTWDTTGSTFTANDAGAPVPSINVEVGDTLATIAGKINGANMGVTATVLTDASGDRLMLRSKTTGEAQGFQLTATGDASLTNLVNGDGASNNPVTTYAADAKATVNGVAVSSSTNAFANTVAGVTFTAVQTTSTPVQIDVTQDTSAITGNIQAFVAAYNAVNDALSSVTAYNASTQQAGIFQGDSSTVSLQSTLRRALQAAVSGSAAGGPFKTLSDIGVVVAGGLGNVNPTGDLEVDTTKLNAALQQPDALKAFFRGASGGSVTDGVGGQIGSVLSGLLSTSGYFQMKTNSLNAELDKENADIATYTMRANNLQTSLQARYTALDTQMSQLNALNSYIQQQVTTWNNIKTSA